MIHIRKFATSKDGFLSANGSATSKTAAPEKESRFASIGFPLVRELRIPEGKGYRLYYAWDGDTVVILLCGGDKSTQERDIETAKRYWRQYHGQH